MPANGPKYDLFSRPNRRTFTVTQLTEELRSVIEGRFPVVSVEGEISNFRRTQASGHCYFTLKDEAAQLSCVLYRTQALLVKAKLADGLQVVVRGRLTVYPPSGQYQLTADTVEPVGAGALALKFEELKRRLAAEGVFDEKHKRPLPFIPRRVGVVSSPTGAAIQDFLRILHRRWPNMPVLLAPARMQGDAAAGEVCRALGRLSAIPDIDVIVITRGGGSIEDLWPFNEESLARAIRRSAVPVVSAIGHEVDFTIADYASDRRASTPSAAAETVVPEKRKLLNELGEWRRRMQRGVTRHVETRRNRLLAQQRSLSNPKGIINQYRLDVDRLIQRVERTVRDRLKNERAGLNTLDARLQRSHPKTHLGRLRQEIARQEHRLRQLMTTRLGDGDKELARLTGRLEAMSPLSVLSRGYSLTFGPDGTLVRRAEDLAPGERVQVRVSEGSFDATVEKVTPT